MVKMVPILVSVAFIILSFKIPADIQYTLLHNKIGTCSLQLMQLTTSTDAIRVSTITAHFLQLSRVTELSLPAMYGGVNDESMEYLKCYSFANNCRLQDLKI